MALPTKQEIFDLFVSFTAVQTPGREPGKKWSYTNPSFEVQQIMLTRIGGNEKLLTYYTSLRDRDRGLAPPPRPK